MTRVALFFTLGLLIDAMSPAEAGETIRFKSVHINVVSRFDTLLVNDQAGRFVALIRASGAGWRIEGPKEPPYRIEIWGTGDYQRDGSGKDHGYGKFTFADGSSYFEEWESEAGGEKAVGRAVYYNGTGRFKDMDGGSAFECTTLGDRFICEVEGWIELP